MPKINGTRKQKAAKLLGRLKCGPLFSAPFDGSPFTKELAEQQFRNWSESWILPNLIDLVPELRKEKQS